MKMEIELTESQAEKVEMLKEHGVSVGEAIDMFFEMKYEIIDSTDQYIDEKIEHANREKAELEERMAKVDEELSTFKKLKDSSMEPDNKIRIIAKDYGTTEKTYDETVHDKKAKFSWSKFV